MMIDRISPRAIGQLWSVEYYSAQVSSTLVKTLMTLQDLNCLFIAEIGEVLSWQYFLFIRLIKIRIVISLDFEEIQS